MSLDAQPGPASARVYREPEVEIQLQILNRLDLIVELLSHPKVELRPNGAWTRQQELDAVAWQTVREAFDDPTSTRADDTH